MIADCNSPTVNANSSVNTNATTYLGVATYSCNTGFYKVSGDLSSTCQHGGTWSATPIACQIYGKINQSNVRFTLRSTKHISDTCMVRSNNSTTVNQDQL